jgi:type VI secretion system protein ImpA
MMPLRDDLLDPIAGENPSGPDLQYDPVFDQIREARREEDDTLPAGDWDRPVKRADHWQVVKLAGESLAKRTKNLRLAASLVESQFTLEGVVVLAPSIEFLRRLQENFWATLYPEIDDGDLQLRVNEIERAARQMALNLGELPLTTSGLTPADYRESRIVGYEADSSTDDRKKTRKAAIEAKKLTAEEFDKAVAATPKAFFVETKAALDEALEQTNKLDRYQRDAYGDQYPQLSSLSAALHEAAGLVNILLTERRKMEPDPVATFEKMEQWQTESGSVTFSVDEVGDTISRKALPKGVDGSTADVTPRQQAVAAVTALSRPQDAYALIVSSAQFLFEADPQSPVPYLVCAALRLGETRRQGASPEPGFAVGPSSYIRQTLRAFAVAGAWVELLRAALPVMAEPSARAWLDLHRYIWRAAQQSGASALAAAVSGTLRELLRLRPEVRHWTLEDDTGAANPETQAWIDAEVLGTGGA